MRQSVQTITVAVTDLAASRAFYSDGLGWTPAAESEEIIYYQVGPGLLFAIFGIRDFAADVGAPIGVESGFSLGHSVSCAQEVDETIELARDAGARILKEPQDAWFGGYHGYFADPDGHRWEVATGREVRVSDDGDVSILLDQRS
jgi:uncharacterized protein